MFTFIAFAKVGRNNITIFYLGRIDESNMQSTTHLKATNPIQSPRSEASSLLQSTQVTTTTITEVKDQKETLLVMERKEQIVRENPETNTLEKSSPSNENTKKKRNAKNSKKKKKNHNAQTNQNRNTVTVQCIRSICEWSGGTYQFPHFAFLIFSLTFPFMLKC
jgi:hypothetical protein